MAATILPVTIRRAVAEGAWEVWEVGWRSPADGALRRYYYDHEPECGEIAGALRRIERAETVERVEFRKEGFKLG